jgi:peptidoglycan/xylan/chitin deacetylase (PgdA/CDA1 family)
MIRSRSSTVLWSAGLTVLAFFGAWIFAFHTQVERIPLAVDASAVSTSSLPFIVNEGDVTSTESFVDEEGTSTPPRLETVVQPLTPTVSVNVPGLRAMDIPYFRRLVGDPKPKSGERTVRVPVLMYHHIRAFRSNDTSRERAFVVTPEAFEAQLKDLVQKGFSFITPDELDAAIKGEGELPSNPVLLTFDDGLREHYTVVLPLLKKYQAKATYFIITSSNHLNGYLKDSMIRELDESGFVTIASHTVNHPYLARMSAAARANEIMGSKQALEKVIGHQINAFAYPYGSWNEQVAKEVQAAGYTLGFGVRLGSRHTPSSRYQLRRIRVQQAERISDLVEGL